MIHWLNSFYIRPITTIPELHLNRSKRYLVIGVDEIEEIEEVDIGDEIEDQDRITQMFIVKNDNKKFVKVAEPLCEIEIWDDREGKTRIR